MSQLNLITNAYERKARLYPALVLLAPAVVTIIAVIAAKLSILRSIGAIIVSCGGTFLLAQLARDAGKSGEKKLFEKWGGIPSIAIFRHRDTRLDAVTKARYHGKLAKLVKGTKGPSVEEEPSDPTAADQTYTAWSTYLRVNTRDTKKYALLFQENVNYGYRRNVWGMRPVGILMSMTSLAIAIISLYLRYQSTGKIDEEVVLSAIFAAMFLALWVFRFSADWVRIPADAYAERLAETVDTMK